MTDHTHHPWLHRLAWLTAVLALLPIGVGAVVTTVDAGMAFPDWLTSDGVFVPLYPWLQSTGDKFLEHGHRLAVILLGMALAVLTGVVFSRERRRDVRAMTVAVIAVFIGQAVLGGQRVIQDERMLALLHGDFAACFFALMGLLVAMTAPRWLDSPAPVDPQRARAALLAAAATLVLFTLQYVLGGLLRHFGSAQAWLIHPWFALAVLAATIGFFVAAIRTESSDLKRAAAWILGLVVLQALLGVATWAVRYGYPQFGMVAVQQSSLQVAVRSLHKIVGLVTFMASAVAVVRAARAVQMAPAWSRMVPVTTPAAGGPS